jgi:hypothetical protein
MPERRRIARYRGEFTLNCRFANLPTAAPASRSATTVGAAKIPK